MVAHVEGRHRRSDFDAVAIAVVGVFGDGCAVFGYFGYPILSYSILSYPIHHCVKRVLRDLPRRANVAHRSRRCNRNGLLYRDIGICGGVRVVWRDLVERRIASRAFYCWVTDTL